MPFNEDYKWVEVQTWYSEESQPTQNSSTGYQPAQANTKRTGSGPDGQLISPEDTPFYEPTANSESVDAAVGGFEQSTRNEGDWTVDFFYRTGDRAPKVLINSTDILSAVRYYNKQTRRYEDRFLIVSMAGGVVHKLYFRDGIGDGTETPPSTLRSILPPDTEEL